MFTTRRLPRSRALAATAIALTLVGVGADRADAQQLTRPVYRVANTNTAAETQPAQSTQPNRPIRDPAVTPAAAQTPDSPFDLTQRPGEHPLMPCLRLAKSALSDMDQRVKDYSCIFFKRERLSGKLGETQKIEMRVRHQPFSIYMKFIQPNPGQEALYVANQNNGKLVAMGSGWKRRFGKINLDPDGAMAMRDQRYPITKAGIRNLTSELIEIAGQDVKYGECEVNYSAAKWPDRNLTMIESIHPVPRKNFRYHKAQIFIDNELRLPVAYRAYSWPREKGGEPVLEEEYMYTQLKINNGFTDADFSPESPGMFD